MKWYALIRENPPKEIPKSCHCGCSRQLTKEEVEGNRNLPLLIHWDKSQLPEAPGFYIVEVQPIGALRP